MKENTIVVRNINGIDVAVDYSKPSSIYFTKQFIEDNNINMDNLNMNNIFVTLKQNISMLPLSLKWELTNICNLNCEFCYIHNHVNCKEIDFETAKPYIDEIVEAGLIDVTLTGGECTMHKDFLAIYEYFKKKGVFVTVYTNGIHLNAEVLKMFKDLPPRTVEMSIYSSIKEDDRAYKNAIILKKMGIDLLVKVTVTTKTKHYFYEVEKWCKENDIKFKFDTDINDAYDASNTSKYQLPIMEKLVFDYKKFEKVPYSEKKITCFDCGAGNISININSKFELGLCSKVEYKVPLRGDTFSRAYGTIIEFVEKVKGMHFEGCQSCYAKSICRMCYARAEIKTDSLGNIHLIARDKFCENTRNYYNLLCNYNGKN